MEGKQIDFPIDERRRGEAEVNGHSLYIEKKISDQYIESFK
jgi:hypothetical protein